MDTKTMFGVGDRIFRMKRDSLVTHEKCESCGQLLPIRLGPYYWREAVVDQVNVNVWSKDSPSGEVLEVYITYDVTDEDGVSTRIDETQAISNSCEAIASTLTNADAGGDV